MPSWNIHTAHADRLLASEGPSALGIRDVDAFLLGNLAPDIYVGYMVPDASRKIPYKDSHFADPSFVPEPRYWEFFEREVVPAADADGLVSDIVLGAWTHLVADNVYNRHANRFIFGHGIQPGEETRIAKQGDFALFGRTLDISLVPQPSPEVLAQAMSFPQYAIEEADVRRTCEVMAGIVADNAARHVAGTPDYVMLPADFFASTFDEADRTMRAGLKAYVRGDRSWGAQQMAPAQ